MNIPLPPVNEKLLQLPHFPAPFQAVIFRNWGLVPKDRLAQVIGTDLITLSKEAEALGLDPELPTDENWLTRGYISVIRANWHTVDYPALCLMLGLSEERLAYVLREDDFLSVKLGGFKPSVPDFRHRPLTNEEKLRTEAIKSAVLTARKALPAAKHRPFDLGPMLSQYSAASPLEESSLFEDRYCYSYCALYGDTFLSRELIDSSFPDELLSAYRSLGVTGLWTHIVLYSVSEFPFEPGISKDWEERRRGMRYLTEKLDRFGLKLFLYFNEPRSMPMSFFEKHPELFGRELGGFGTLCLSVEAVRDYLRDSVRSLVEDVPLLGGFFTITASENLTSCFSHSQKKTDCPRCEGTSAAETFALVNRLVAEGVGMANGKARVIAWSWGWDPDITPEVVRLLPKEVSVMGVSEQGVEKTIGTTVTSVVDYSISVEGPGEYALSTWNTAHRTGHRAFAKMQVNNSWELAAVPFIPAFEKPYRHLKRLMEAGYDRPDSLMLSWSLGGYPSPVLEMLSHMYSGRTTEFSRLMSLIYPNVPTEPLCRALHVLSEAFDKYPFHIGTAYTGPQHYAPANLFFDEKTGFSATMVGFPYDDIESWRSIFPTETYVEQLRLLSLEWNEGTELLEKALESAESSVKTDFLLNCTKACANHFRAMYLNCAFVLLRDGKGQSIPLTREEILLESEKLASDTARLCALEPTLGYESSNHYFYNLNALLEKIINCRYLLTKGR